MKKRHIAIVIAGLVMGTAGVAAENRDVFSLSSDDAYATPEAAQIESIPGDVAVVELAPVELAPVEVVQVEPVQVASVATQPLVVVSPQPAMSNTFPPSADDMVWKPLPKQAKYLEERAARLQVATVRGDTFPPSADDMIWKPLPKQAKYLEERAARLQVATVRGDMFPQSANDTALEPLPALARY